jgi:hypothetical protein
MLKAILDFYHHTQAALKAGIQLGQIMGLAIVAEIARMKELPVQTAEAEIKAIIDRVRFSFAEWGVEVDD